LPDAGQGGWGSAATAASAALGAVLFIFITIGAALAYSIAGSGNQALTTGLNDFAWALGVMIAIPAAMLIMSGSFGLFRAGMISKPVFTVGIAAVLLVLAGGTTWASDGFWAADGAMRVSSRRSLRWPGSRPSAASSFGALPRRAHPSRRRRRSRSRETERSAEGAALCHFAMECGLIAP
jgi:hypothetical protein